MKHKQVYTLVVGGEPMLTFRSVDAHDNDLFETARFLLRAFEMDASDYEFRLATIPEREVWARGQVEHMLLHDQRPSYTYTDLLNVNLPAAEKHVALVNSRAGRR
jgi:hypothetical protein